MTIRLELDPELEQRLTSAAQMRHQPVEDYLRQLMDEALPKGSAKYRPTKTLEEFREAMIRLGRFGPKDLSGVDTTWDRDSIYDDHD